MRFFALSALALASLVVNAQEDPSASDAVSTTTSLTTDPSLSTGLTDPSGTLSLSSSSATAASSSSSASGSKKSTKTSSGASSAPTDTSTDSVAAATIPTGISSGCTAFLNTLNTDAALAKCLSPYYAATSAFSSASGDKSSVTSALNNLSAASGCATTLRSLLSAFYSACPAELTGSNPNTDVRKFYDDLYIIYPMRQALCAKDNGSYCALNSASSNAAQVSDYKQAVLSGGDGISSFSKNGVPYLFATPSMSTDELCTPCNQEILGYYAGWEASTPYAFGILNSPTLSGQKDLLASINSQCGSTYLQVIKNNAEDNATNDAASSRGSVMGGMTTLLVGAIGAWIML